jgi:hypothetical protein
VNETNTSHTNHTNFDDLFRVDRFHIHVELRRPRDYRCA